LRQKLRTIAALGVDTLWLIHFDEAFSRQTGEGFIRALVRDFGHLDSIRVGREFTFGHQRSGNVALLQALGKELKFEVHGVAAVSLDGQPVSSTRIREAIRAGQLDAVRQMLGRAYALAGLVERGDQRGGKLGFPTANLDVRGLVLPPHGVYAAHARVGRTSYRSVLNIGYRPTLQSGTPQLRVEAHLLDFNGDLYGEELEVTFVQKLREEQRFPSLEALREQIGRDVATARVLFEAN
jgi:riboflavin kinase/FMN adenylyltransferase